MVAPRRHAEIARALTRGVACEFTCGRAFSHALLCGGREMARLWPGMTLRLAYKEPGPPLYDMAQG